MLEIAQRFEAQVNARFKTAIRLRDGQRQLTYEEEVDATAGAVTIPDEFVLSVVPFVGSDPETVRARLRFRMSSGKPTIGYELIRPHEVEGRAFESTVASVAEAKPRADRGRGAVCWRSPLRLRLPLVSVV